MKCPVNSIIASNPRSKLYERVDSNDLGESVGPIHIALDVLDGNFFVLDRITDEVVTN